MQFLLAPKSDKELACEMQSLGYLIQRHVEDNYHLSPVRQNSESLSQVLEDLGLGEGGHHGTQAMSAGGHGYGSRDTVCSFEACHREGNL